MALEEDSTVQSLLAEALNKLFEDYGKSPIT
ncbi:ribbon-helix-helix domain-containing protein (plasmid) [Nostoc sp. UHCC 0302]